MSSTNETTKGVVRHRFVYAFLDATFGWLLKLIYEFHPEKAEVKSKTFLCLCNHTMDRDPLCLVIGIHRHVRFVASENIMKGFGGWFVKTLAGPIPRRKGASADSTVEAVLENLKAGVSVAMFPEGNRTWDGETGYISPRTSALVKKAGVGLVLYRITGGYLKSPRWAGGLRQGPCYGRVAREILPEEIAAMTEDEIYEVICRELYVDAYQEQREHLHRYTGKNLAEGIENALFVCPQCGGIGTLESKGNAFWCAAQKADGTDCGLKGEYTKHGFLKGEKLPFDTVLDWSRWQKEYLREHAEMLEAQTQEAIAISDDLHIYETMGDGERVTLSENGTAYLFGDRIELYEGTKLLRTYAWKNMTKLGMFRRSRVFFTTEEGFFELSRPEGISGQMYFAFYRVLSDKSYY